MDDSNSKILSNEEVDALAKVSQDSENDFTKLINNGNTDEAKDKDTVISSPALTNIIELSWLECEKIFSTFIKTKVTIRIKESNLSKFSDYLKTKEKVVYSIFHINNATEHCMIIIPMPFLHQMMNCLFGGVVNATDKIIEQPGKIGIIVAEKLASLALEAFANACKEYKAISFEKYKTVSQPNLITKVNLDSNVYIFTYTVSIGDCAMEFNLTFPEAFIAELLPITALQEKIVISENPLWKKFITSQLIDSDVTLIAALPKIQLTTHELMELKIGDSIPIGDPTLVDVSSNNVKLFSGVAAQAHETRIVKIVGDD